MKLRVATCMKLPEPDTDAVIFAAALAAAGIEAAVVAWDDLGADWDAAIPTVIRSTWNYALRLGAYLAWIDRVARAAPLWNPPDVVHANVRKDYLAALAGRGVPIVPTVFVSHKLPVESVIVDLHTDRAPEKIVIKPVVGAGSLDTRVFVAGDPAADAHLASLVARGAAMVQPYVASVDSYGERSMVWIDGELTHAIRKTPRFSGDSERIDGPFPIADDERAVAIAALAPYADRILYGRVDLARDDAGHPMVMELELVEPSLFFTRHPPALDRYISGLVRRLATR